MKNNIIKNRLLMLEDSFNNITHPLNWPFYIRVNEWKDLDLKTFNAEIVVYRTSVKDLSKDIDDYEIEYEYICSIKDSINLDQSVSEDETKDYLRKCLIDVFNKLEYDRQEKGKTWSL